MPAVLDATTTTQLEQLRAKWQRLLDVLQGFTGVPAALVMRVHTDQIEVFAKSTNPANVYEQGERADLGSGLYCEDVMRSRTPLLVPDATADPEWDHNPDIEVGMISYLGYPVTWPTGEVFGTICILDTSANPYSAAYRSLLAVFRDAVEADLAAMLREAALRRSKDDLVVQRQALARANAELENFAYVASHDLNEPLRAIKGFTTLLIEQVDVDSDPKAREYADFILDATAHMGRLIDDLLTFSRVGRVESEAEDVALSEVAEDTLRLLGPMITDTGAEVRVDALPVVLASRTQQGLLLRNLVSNALKFHRPGTAPHVRVAAERSGDLWEIHVDDDGIGIAPEQRERIFRIFQRLHPRERYPGTGIGLAICKKIVESGGGRIWVQDSPLGGSSFRFTVAAAQQANPPGD